MFRALHHLPRVVPSQISRGCAQLSRESRRERRNVRVKPTQKGQSTAAYVALGVSLSSLAGTGLWLGYLEKESKDKIGKTLNSFPPIAFLGKQMDVLTKPFKDPSREKLLPNFHDIPGLNIPATARAPPTLVLAVEDTLIRSEWDRKHGWRHAKRPGVDKFLETMARHYEIVLFSKQHAAAADEIVFKLDPKNLAMHRLFRESTRFVNGVHVKDIANLNRDSKRVLIIDADPNGYSLQPENGVPIAPFTQESGQSDTALLELMPFLLAVVTENVKNIPETLDTFRDSNGLIDDLPARYSARRGAAQKQQEERKAKGLGGLLRTRK